MTFDDLKAQGPWTKIGGGTSHLLLMFHLGQSLLQVNKIAGEGVFRIGAYLQRKSANEMWAPQSDRDFLGERLVAALRRDPTYLTETIGELRHTSDELNVMIATANPKTVSLTEYTNIWNKFDEHYLPHCAVKYIADYLSEEELTHNIDALQEVRLYIEPTYNNLKQLMWRLAEFHSALVGVSPDFILSTTRPEFESFLTGAALPPTAELEKRFAVSGLLFTVAENQLIVGEEVAAVERIIVPPLTTHVSGKSAHKGKVRGRAHVVFDPLLESDSFKEGEILITVMTRPDYLPMVKKAAALVTDSGGVLTHAAISAREFKKPCVIGTETATKIFKTGDMIEVDADTGIVRLLS